jgi:regulator of protease activity HflC (stomatin/prohibitin superfamily)
MRILLRHTVLVVVGVMVVLTTACTRVKPDEIGVRTLNFGKNKGVIQKDYAPGYHRYLWPLDSWHRFPSTVQRLRFSQVPTDTDPARLEEPLQVTSADGHRVAVTAAAFFRIADDQAHSVLSDSGPGDRYQGVVRSLAQDAVRVVFGRLKTEAFYDPIQREIARAEGVNLLRTQLEPRGVDLLDFLVETVEFEPNYENLIRDKKIADQRVELEKAKARAAVEKGKVANIQAETVARVQKIERETESDILRIDTDTQVRADLLNAEANKYAARARADADLYAEQKKAEGQRQSLEAEAEGTRHRNAALTGDGSQNLVALEALQKMNLSEVTFPSAGFDWFNPRAMARRIGASDDPSTPALDVFEDAGPSQPRESPNPSNLDGEPALAR